MIKGGGEKFYNLENLKTQPCKQGSPVLPPYDQRCVFKTYKLTIFLSPSPLAKQHWLGNGVVEKYMNINSKMEVLK
jgi:hypothetical protein